METVEWLKDCEICNVGLCKRLTELTDGGLSARAASREMTEDCEGLWTPDQILARYKYYTKGSGKRGGRKPPKKNKKPPVFDPLGDDSDCEMLFDLTPEEKHEKIAQYFCDHLEKTYKSALRLRTVEGLPDDLKKKITENCKRLAKRIDSLDLMPQAATVPKSRKVQKSGMKRIEQRT